jgi:hypothetical protein
MTGDRLASLVAQCTPAQASCELPTGLPWYFGLAIAAVWLAVVVGAVRVALHLLRSRREARRDVRRRPDRRELES